MLFFDCVSVFEPNSPLLVFCYTGSVICSSSALEEEEEEVTPHKNHASRPRRGKGKGKEKERAKTISN